MSRKDTIIIAVLMNAALLSLLFILASRGGSEKALERGNEQISYQEVKAIAPTAFQTPTFDLNPPNLPSLIAMDDTVSNSTATSSSNSASTTTPTSFDKSFPLDEPYTPKKKAATPAKPAAPANNAKTVQVTVKKGDSLDRIAKANGSTIEAIVSANNLDSSKLDIGDVLQVPVLKKVPSKDNTVKPPTNPAPSQDPVANPDNQTYIVKKGDNPWKIAKQFHMRYDQFLKLNNLDEIKAKSLQVGDKVQVQEQKR